MQAFAGIDVGTSSVRATAINAGGEIVAQSREDLPPPESPAEGCFEQQPLIWLQATLDCLSDLTRQLKNDSLLAIAVDGTSGTTLITDNQNQPLGQALMYNDSRASMSIDHLGSFIPADHLTRSPSSSLAKALFLLNQANSINSLEHCACIVHQADWLTSQLTGLPGIADENNCLKLGYDSIGQDWPQWIRNAPFSIYQKLPRVVTPGTPIAPMDMKLVDKLGLNVAPMMIAGTTDSTASTLAAGISNPGEAVTTLGTTMVMKVISKTPVFSAPHGIYSHRLNNDHWLVGGASNSGGNVLQKYFSLEAIEKLSSMITPDKPTGLDYYPLACKGERFPINDVALKPRLSPRPDDDHVFLQAIFEGFARIETLAYQLIADMGGPLPVKLLTAGGKAVDNNKLTVIRERALGISIGKAMHTEASYGVARIARNAFKHSTA